LVSIEFKFLLECVKARSNSYYNLCCYLLAIFSSEILASKYNKTELLISYTMGQKYFFLLEQGSHTRSTPEVLMQPLLYSKLTKWESFFQIFLGGRGLKHTVCLKTTPKRQHYFIFLKKKFQNMVFWPARDPLLAFPCYHPCYSMNYGT